VGRLLLAVEVVALLVAAVFGFLWWRAPTGPYEPVTFLSLFVGTTLVDFVRRRLPSSQVQEQLLPPDLALWVSRRKRAVAGIATAIALLMAATLLLVRADGSGDASVVVPIVATSVAGDSAPGTTNATFTQAMTPGLSEPAILHSKANDPEERARAEVEAIHRNAKSLQLSYEREDALEKGIEFAIRSKVPDAALPLVAELGLGYERSDYHRKLFQAFLDAGEYERAESIIPLLPLSYERDDATKDLIQRRSTQ
jgi:hypothetical protein